MEHLDLAGVLTTPTQWNGLPVFEQQDAIYLSSSRQMLEPIMEETSEDEESALNSWQQYEHSISDVESSTAERAESRSGEAATGGASFWSSAESDTGSVIRIEVTKDNDSTSERDFLCPPKRPRRCEESLLQIGNPAEEEVVLRRPALYADLKNNSLERFLNYDHLSRDSWGTNSQQRSSLGSRRGFDDFFSDSDSLSYNSLSRSSSLIQFESLERQLLQDQHASMSSLGNSSPSLLSFDLQNSDDSQSKAASNNSGNNSANNSRRGSQSSLLKKFESLDGRLHQTYYDLDKLNFDDMDAANIENISRTNLKLTTTTTTTHLAELRSDSESSSEGSEESSRPQSVLSPGDSTDNEFFLKKFQRTNSQQSKKGKSSAENLSEDSGYCEPSLGFGLRRSKSQNLLQNYEKFSEEDEEMENKSLIHSTAKQTFIELNVEQQQANIKHSIKLNEFKNTTTRQEEVTVTPPISPHLEFLRHKQRTETHSPSPVSSEVSTSSSISSSKSTSNNSTTSAASSSTSSSSSSTSSSTSSATTCASKASFTWLMPSSGRTNSRVYDEEDDRSQISLNDLRELKTSTTSNCGGQDNVEIFSGKFKNNIEICKDLQQQQNECLECKNKYEKFENFFKESKNSDVTKILKCRNCGEQSSRQIPTQRNLKCDQCKQNDAINLELIENRFEKNNENCENFKINCKNCGEQKIFNEFSKNSKTLERITEFSYSPVAIKKFQNSKSFSCENLQHSTEDDFKKLSPTLLRKFQNFEPSTDHENSDRSLEYDSAQSTPEAIKRFRAFNSSPKHLRKFRNLENFTSREFPLYEDHLQNETLDHSLEFTSASSTPEFTRRVNTVKQNPLNGPSYPPGGSSDSDYSPLRLRKNLNNLMLNWPAKTCSVPNELNQIGRKKKLKKSKIPTKTRNSPPPHHDSSDTVSSSEELEINNIKRSLSWSCHLSSKQLDLELPSAAKTHPDPSFYPEAKNLGLLHQSYYNLANLNLDLPEQEKSPKTKMADRRISSDCETEIVCKNNFLLDELSAHYDRTASILNDKPADVVDAHVVMPKVPPRLRKSSNSSYSEKEDMEADQVQHVQLVIRKPPARQKKNKDSTDKTNSLTYDFSFSHIMQGAGQKTFDQDPTNLKTSYAQSLEKCNFDCREVSNQDLNPNRSIPKRRFHSQAANSKKKNMVSSTPNLNAFDFNQDDIEDDMFVSSAHTSMHQLPLSQTQKPLGILLPAGSRTSFGKEVSFCPVVSKYCWQEQSSEECNDGTDELLEPGEESEDELLDNADATVIYNTKENENIGNKFNEEFLKSEQQNVYQAENDNLVKETANLRETAQKQQVEKITVNNEEINTSKQTETPDIETQEIRETELSAYERECNKEPTHEQNEQHEIEIETETERVNGSEVNTLELETQTSATSSNELLKTPVTVSLTTNVNNETLPAKPDHIIKSDQSNNNTNNKRVNSNSPQFKPTVVVARPLSIQLPILSEPPINRAHHILYASQQMLDNFQKQQQNEEYEHYKTQSTQNLSKMSSTNNNNGQQQQQQLQVAAAASNSKINNNNEVMKSKFKHEEKHPNSKGFLSRFTNGFRFSLRRNKKKLQKENQNTNEDGQSSNTLPNQTKANGSSVQIQNAKTKSLPSANKEPDFIYIPLKGPLPPRHNNGNSMLTTNGNANQTVNNDNVNATVPKNATVLSNKKGAKTKDSNDKQKVTGKPPIPPQQQQQQQQQLQKLQSAQSSTQQQQQPLVEVGLSRFYTETNTPLPSTQEFLSSEREFNENNQQSCSNSESLTNENENENMTAVNANQPINYDFTSPSRATVSQKTQMFNNLSRNSDSHTPQQPKIGLIETNLDTHETVITGKTRSLMNIGPNQHHNHHQQQQKLYAGNKRLHHNATTNSHRHNNHGDDDDDDYYDDNDDDEVVVRPDGTVVVIKNAGSSSSSQAQQIASVRRPHKSMEFLLDKENQKDVMTTSEESHTELINHEPTMKQQRKKKLRRSLTWKKDNSLVETNQIFSTDSDSDCKSQNLNLINCTLPKTKKCSNYVKKLLFKTANSSISSEQATINSINPELSILELDSSLIRQVNSPSKIKTAYTLTVMSSPSPHSESDFYDSDLPRTPIKESSRSWPSLLEVGMVKDCNLLKEKSVTTEFTDLAKSKLEQEKLKLLMDSFIDQGFETGSNDMESPMRLPKKTPDMPCHNNATFMMDKSLTKLENPRNFSTPNKDKPVQQIFTAQLGAAQQNLISPIPVATGNRRPSSLTMQAIQEDTSLEDSEQLQHTPSSLNESATFFSNEPMRSTSNSPLGLTHKVESSQFWVSSGDFTASITIHHYETERLMLLSNIFGQKSMETKEMNFGIDDQKFSLDNSATPEDIIRKVPKEKNCSQYWFSTGEVLIPFTGKQMSTKKIQSFYNYIRELMEESGCLRFGIDAYEFSNIYQQAPMCSAHINSWSQASPIKTSDLDQSDMDSEEFEQSLTFSALSGNQSDTASLKSDDIINNQPNYSSVQEAESLEQIFEDARLLNLSKTQTDELALETQFTVPEMLKTLQIQQTKLKSLEERMINCADTDSRKFADINDSPDYMRKLRSIISAIDNIGRGNGFNACSIEQLESFMFFLSRYADLCLANCTAHIEKILDVVMNQRSFQA